MKSLFTVLVVTLLFASGCSFKVAKNAEEFKKMVPESMFGKQETFTADRPLTKIAATFSEKTDKCFRKSFKRTSCMTNGYGATSCSTTIMHYNPKVKKMKNKMQLTIQTEIEGAIRLGEDPPKGGDFSLVADFEPKGKNKTKVDLYYGWAGSDAFVKTIKRWSNGKTRGCPDLTQN